MRYFIIVLLVTGLAPIQAIAQGCGLAPLPPLPPLGCQRMEPQCVCDANGRCYWTFICIRS